MAYKPPTFTKFLEPWSSAVLPTPAKLGGASPKRRTSRAYAASSAEANDADSAAAALA